MAGVGRKLLSVNSLVLGGLALGFVSNVLIASIFGLSRRVDAFFAAMMLPSLFMVLCVDYLGKNFLPVYSSARSEGETRASEMASCIVTVVALVATAVAATLAVYSAPVFDVLLPGFGEDDTVLVSRYFRIMAPAIVLMAITTFHEYVCQYNEKFVAVFAIRTLLPLANLVSIVVLGPVVGEYALPFGYLAGHTLVFILIAWLAPYRFVPNFRVRASYERRVFSNSAVVMSTGLLARTRSIVTNYLASTLGAGAISALALAIKITEPVQRGAFSGLRVILFSRTARLFAEDGRDEAGRLYAIGLCVSFLLISPMLWWVAFHSEAIVRLLFGRGEFTPQMTGVVAATLLALTPAVLFNGVNQLLSNAFYAMDRVKVPAITMPFGTLVYVACAIPLSRALETQGLALATSLTSVLLFIVLMTLLARLLTRLEIARTLLRLVAYLALSGAAMLGASALLAPLNPLASMLVGLPLGLLMYGAVLASAREWAFVHLLRYARDALPRRVALR